MLNEGVRFMFLEYKGRGFNCFLRTYFHSAILNFKSNRNLHGLPTTDK